MLHPISFDLNVGQITGVVGRNASGKTTLLRIIMGELAQKDGVVSYPLLTRTGKGWGHIKNQISFVPQLPEPWQGLLRHNLNYIASSAGFRGQRNKEIVDWHMERFGLSGYEDAKWGEISAGFKIRFELVRALLAQPRILVLDEPLAYLDVQSRQEFLQNLEVIASSLERPVSVIVTSQHLHEIETVADQMIFLDNGQCRYCGATSSLGENAEQTVLQFDLKCSQAVIREVVASLHPVSINPTTGGYIITFNGDLERAKILNTLMARFGEELTGFRDITRSLRAMFEEDEEPSTNIEEGSDTGQQGGGNGDH